MENIKSKNIIMEIEGKTVEEAVKKALSMLKVPKSQLKIKVLSEEQKGLFGMQGAKPAKISVSVISPGSLKKKA
jgi:spoIIIJ-associated protein